MNTLSLIIIAYNRPEDLLELLTNIAELEDVEQLKEIIILNNASTVSFEQIKLFVDQHPNIPFHYLVSEENLGVSRGRNYATKFATGDILFYLDDDVILKDTSILKKVVASFSSTGIENRKLGAVSFKVFYASNLQMQVNAFPHKDFNLYKDKTSFSTYYYTGCAHAIVREAWLKYGGYPEDFFYGMEEYDFSYWLINNGYYLKYDGAVQIFHKESPLGRKPHYIKLKMMWVNKSKVAWKYLPKRYFYSTTLMWSFEFLRKTNFNLPHFFQGWKEIINIPKNEKRQPVDHPGLQYLKQVKARLAY